MKKPLLWLLLLFILPVGHGVAQPSGETVADAPSFVQIDSLRTHGQFQSALARLDSITRHVPPRSEALWRRALLLTDIGKEQTDEDEAIALYREALSVADSARQADSTNAWAHLVTALAAGRLTLHVGRSERVQQSRAVKRHTDRALTLDPTLAPAYHLRGRWHREVADLNFIKRALVKAMYGGLPDASFEQAIRDFLEAIERESKPYNHLELAKTYLEIGREEDAKAQLQRTLDTSGSPFDDVHKQEARALLQNLD